MHFSSRHFRPTSFLLATCYSLSLSSGHILSSSRWTTMATTTAWRSIGFRAQVPTGLRCTETTYESHLSLLMLPTISSTYYLLYPSP
ncbi:hypothetical protein F5Y00DRAFT_224061, partial [Daldinia vernicosa]|uniref:uncharacterized protein n=1 Tax=Daldinia vernicosa TaxID=114800 RepID=UPI002007DA0A